MVKWGLPTKPMRRAIESLNELVYVKFSGCRRCSIHIGGGCCCRVVGNAYQGRVSGITLGTGEPVLPVVKLPVGWRDGQIKLCLWLLGINTLLS